MGDKGFPNGVLGCWPNIYEQSALLTLVLNHLLAGWYLISFHCFASVAHAKLPAQPIHGRRGVGDGKWRTSGAFV